MESSFIRLMNVILRNNVSFSDEKSTYLPFRSREASQVLYHHHLHLRSSSFAPNNSTHAANTARLALKASSRRFSLLLGLGQRRYLERSFTGFMDSFLYFGKGRRPPRMEERTDDGALLSPQPPEPPPPTYKPGSLSHNSNSTRMAFIELFRSEQRPRAPQTTAILRIFFFRFLLLPPPDERGTIRGWSTRDESSYFFSSSSAAAALPPTQAGADGAGQPSATYFRRRSLPASRHEPGRAAALGGGRHSHAHTHRPVPGQFCFD